jgi:hypothetical protein
MDPVPVPKISPEESGSVLRCFPPKASWSHNTFANAEGIVLVVSNGMPETALIDKDLQDRSTH